jgi:APA family basic amino acid/polyamine antiporter
MKNSNDQMGIWMTGALVAGTIIGAGIFMLPVTLAPLGINAILGWVISGAGAVAIAVSLGRLSHLGDDGVQANIERVLGKTPAFLGAWSFWVSNWVSQPIIALAGASALSWVDPHLTGNAFVIPVAIASVVLLTAVNAMGARAAGGMAVITLLIKLLPLGAVILLLGIRMVSHAPIEPLAPMPITPGNLATAAALTFFALTGFENITALVGRVREPARTIPLALLGGTLFVALIYLASSSGVQLLLPAKVIAVSPAPFADVLVAQWGRGIASLAAAAIAVAAFGCLNGMILATGELGYSMGLRGDLPKIMTWTRGNNTPIGSQIVGGALSILLILANSNRTGANLFTFIILLSTSALLVVYLGGTLASWRASSSLLGRVTAIIALLFILFATYGSGFEADMWCLALLAIGLAIRAIVHRVSNRSIGAR